MSGGIEALAREIAAFPPNCVMSDRRSVYETCGMELGAALGLEWSDIVVREIKNARRRKKLAATDK